MYKILNLFNPIFLYFALIIHNFQLIKLKYCKCIVLQELKECKHKRQSIHQIGVESVKKSLSKPILNHQGNPY